MKAKTVIVDVDGVIFAHWGEGASTQWSSMPVLLPGVIEQFDQWESESTCIVLMTARKESCRSTLEHALRVHGLYWDHLIMGVGHGQRILINDRKPCAAEPSCIAIEVERNEGLSWKT